MEATLPQVYRSSPWRFIPLLLLSLLFVAGGIFVLRVGEETLIGWASVVFFGLGAGIFAWQLLDRRPRLTLTEAGIEDRMLGVGLIRWADIVGVERMNVFTTRFLLLQVRNLAEYDARLPGWKRRVRALNQRAGFGALNLNLTGLPVRATELEQLILLYARRAEFLGPLPPAAN